jgi:hypothetical protein
MGGVGVRICVIALVACLTATPAAWGAGLFEGFNAVGVTPAGADGPPGLTQSGWTFRNQSAPRGARGWFGVGIEPYEGTSALAADYASSVCNTTGVISNWAIVPAVEGQAAGDTLSFAVRGGSGSVVDRMQVRYSPTGSTATGSGAEDVGSFTEVLLDWRSQRWAANDWTEQRITLPGPGRIAFRYYLPGAGDCSSWAYLLRIDGVTIGTPPAGPVPLPQPGQTVVWDRPMEIDGRTVIPKGATVEVRPGAEIRATAGSSLVVDGTLRGAGTASAPITVTAPSVYPPLLDVGGTVDLGHAVVEGQVRVGSGATTRFAETTFRRDGTVNGASMANGAYVDIRRSRFEGVDLRVDRATVVLRDVAFANATASALGGYTSLAGVTIDGGTLALSRDGQPVYVDGVAVRNAPGSGLELGGWNFGTDFEIGPDVVLEGNRHPVGLFDGGLLPGSALPTTGNANNAVTVGAYGVGPVSWADTGLPYELPEGRYASGDWKLEPGVRVRVGPGGEIKAQGLVARGTEGAPVIFERLDPARRWAVLERPLRLEHAVVDGSSSGLVFSGTAPPRYVDSSIVRNNEQSIVGSAVVRGTQFLANGFGPFVGFPGDLNGATNPNSFIGNGVRGASDARHNWWGSPTGPQSPENPGGIGSWAASGVPVTPFRTSPPDSTDSPPTVELHRTAFLAEPGRRIALRWDARDDGTIASQRILFSREGDSPSSYSVLATLPAGQRTFEWTVPSVGFQVTGGRASIRVEAVDETGQIGWDAVSPDVPSERVARPVTLRSAPAGTLTGGTSTEVCFTNTGDGNSVYGYLFVDGDQRVLPLGALISETGCLRAELPTVSTDSARIGLKLYGSTNDFAWTFTPEFAIRPDARVGDAPPAVAVTAPAGGTFAPGAVVPISWTASDDERVRGFTLQASYDGARTWHQLADLPASATTYAWQTPSGAGLGPVRLRVIARDLRFQTSSATTAVTIGSVVAAATPAAPQIDTVTIATAEYRPTRRALRIEATSTRADARLVASVTATGQVIGTLTPTGDGRHTGAFSWGTDPRQLTVRSSAGATRTVATTRR